MQLAGGRKTGPLEAVQRRGRGPRTIPQGSWLVLPGDPTPMKAEVTMRARTIPVYVVTGVVAIALAIGGCGSSSGSSSSSAASTTPSSAPSSTGANASQGGGGGGGGGGGYGY